MIEWFLWLMFDPVGLMTFALSVNVALAIVVVALRVARRAGRWP